MKKLVPFVVIALAGCIGPGEDPNVPPGSGGSGSDTGSGGSGSGGSQGSGGNNGTGGAVSASGGQTGSGGRDASGGSGSGGQGSGGALGTGGFTATGGATGSGGSGSGGMGSGGGVGTGGGAGAGVTGSGGRGSGGGGGSGASGMTGSGGAVAAVCTSKKMWTGGNGVSMRPGNDCTGCHGFTIAGTIYPTQHEPNDCDGTAANGLKVVVTGADGKVTTLTPDATSGNFYSSTAIKAPFSAKVTNSAGGSRAMATMQTKGACNSCHTQDGANSAPGRIMAP